MIGLAPEWDFVTKPCLAVDTETNNLRAHEPGGVFLISWAGADWEDCCAADDDAGLGRFYDACESVPRVVMANAAFDVHHLRSSGIINFLTSGHEIMDVQTLARVTMPERGFQGYRLKDLGKALLGEDAAEEQRVMKELAKEIGIGSMNREGAYRELWEASPQVMEDYAMQDVRLTYDLFELLVKRHSARPNDLRVFMFETAVQRELLFAEQHGILVDKDRLALLRVEVEARIATASARLTDLYATGASSFFRDTGWGVNELRDVFEGPPPGRGGGLIGSHAGRAERGAHMIGLLVDGRFDELGAECAQLALGVDEGSSANQTALRCALLGCGVPLWRSTEKSGQLATNKAALAEFAGEHEVIDVLFEWRGAAKLLSTYVAALERANPRVHASFLSCEARTSRTSARSPNVQNLPRGSGARECLIPAAGNALLVLDYDSIEVRGLAHYLEMVTKHPELRQSIESGLDAHTRTAAMVYMSSCAPGWAPERYFAKAGPGDEMRTRAKRVTFGVLYGQGYKSLARQEGMTEEEGRTLVGDIKAALTGFYDLQDALTVARQRRGCLRTILGRRLDVPANKRNIFLNSVVQGSAAEAMKLGMLAAAEPLRALGYQTILVVHDELVAEGPVENADAAQAAATMAMESVSDYFSCALNVSGGWTTESYAKAK